MPRASVRLLESDTAADLETRVNEFLAGLALAAVLDVEYGMTATGDGSWRWHWCLVVYKGD